MGYVSIANQLEVILSAITGVNVVYDHEPKLLEKYPAATIIASAHKDSFKDLQANKREFTFVVRLYYRTEDAATGESVMRTNVDAVIGAIEGNATLNGACDWAKPSEATWGYTERDVPLRYAQITVTAVVRVPVR